jgi:serpin B
MKHFALISAMTAILIGSVSCEKIGGDDPKDNPYKKLELTTKSAEFAKQGNDFAFNFIDRVNGVTQGDFIISPLSMQFLLGMILDGAQGQTADEICSVLGYGAGEVVAVNEYCQAMLQQLPNMDKKTKLAIANAIVVNQNYPLLDSYKSTVGKHYDAEVANMDFDDISGSTKKINKWCSDHTNGLITEIIKNVNPEMLAYLLNAMYFKSEWKQKFPKGNTSNETFTAEDGTKKSVPMMKMEKSFTYQDNDVLRTVRLPYGNGVFSMMVILPAEGKTLADVTGYLNGKEWNAFVSNLVSCDVDLWLPKFETQFRIKLNDILCAMGMPTAFDKNLADFTAMSSISPYLSYVQQDAIIKVDEEGTEAAVVSSAGMMPTSAGPGDHIVFHADHPFLYLITESSTGAILFAGKYSGK